jgi:lysophospholipase L1-like esterase
MIYTKTIPDIVNNASTLNSVNRYAYKFSNTSRISYNKELIRYFEKKIDDNDIHFVNVLGAQCGEKYNDCRVISDVNHSFYYFDGGHFTLKGSEFFGKRLKSKYPELFIVGQN